VAQQGLFDPTREGWTIPAGYTPVNPARCRGCGVVVMWTITPRDRRMPIDRDGTSHFATCPEASRFRKRGDR
jgi:hypothetical protein